MPPTKNMWLVGAIVLSMSQHFLILYSPWLAVRIIILFLQTFLIVAVKIVCDVMSRTTVFASLVRAMFVHCSDHTV